MGAQMLRLEGLDPETEVVQVTPFGAWGGPSLSSQGPVHSHQIHQGTACPQLIQSKFRLFAFHGAAQYVPIESDHPGQIHYPEHEVVDALDLNHLHFLPKQGSE
jgi:hypothetical protein